MHTSSVKNEIIIQLTDLKKTDFFNQLEKMKKVTCKVCLTADDENKKIKAVQRKLHKITGLPVGDLTLTTFEFETNIPLENTDRIEDCQGFYFGVPKSSPSGAIVRYGDNVAYSGVETFTIDGKTYIGLMLEIPGSYTHYCRQMFIEKTIEILGFGEARQTTSKIDGVEYLTYVNGDREFRFKSSYGPERVFHKRVTIAEVTGHEDLYTFVPKVRSKRYRFAKSILEVSDIL